MCIRDRYSKTQNMDKPEITYTGVPASSWRKDPKARKGAVLYKFDDGSTCRSGWHEKMCIRDRSADAAGSVSPMR